MLKPETYSQLYDALNGKGFHLINTPESYRHCHYFPESYAIIKEYTPTSIFIPLDASFGIEQVMQMLTPFGDRPLILKDYVKSRKHEWNEACYIPSASDQRLVEKVVSRFLELQGDDVNKGLVFREFVNFRR